MAVRGKHSPRKHLVILEGSVATGKQTGHKYYTLYRDAKGVYIRKNREKVYVKSMDVKGDFWTPL